MSREHPLPDREPAVVLAATDFSSQADQALRQAHERARATNATLIVCHIIPNLARANMLFPQRHLEQSTDRPVLHRGVLQALTERTCRVTGRDASQFQALVDDGTPYARIIELAEKIAAELIVVAGRSSAGLSEPLVGSTAERVVRYAAVPVLIARAIKGNGNLLVASDLSDPSIPSLVAAAREARRRRMAVTALHCIEPIVPVELADYGAAGALLAVPDAIPESRQQAAQKLAEALLTCGLEADQRVEVGPAAATIVAVADKIGAELIVIGTRGRTGLRRVLLGSVAESVIRLSARPVLVVRQAGG